MANDDYYDRVALRLYRKYSKDDLIRFYKNRLSLTQLEHGQDKSYIDELEHEISRLKALNEALSGENAHLKTEALKEIKREELYQQLLGHNRKLIDQNKKLKKSNDELIFKQVQQNAKKEHPEH